MALSREEFARWSDDPVTRYVIIALKRAAERQQEEWLRISWQNGKANAAALSELRTRGDCYFQISEMGYEDWCLAMDEEPQPVGKED